MHPLRLSDPEAPPRHQDQRLTQPTTLMFGEWGLQSERGGVMSLVRHWLSAHRVWAHGAVPVGRNGSLSPMSITCCTLDVTQLCLSILYLLRKMKSLA